MDFGMLFIRGITTIVEDIVGRSMNPSISFECEVALFTCVESVSESIFCLVQFVIFL